MKACHLYRVKYNSNLGVMTKIACLHTLFLSIFPNWTIEWVWNSLLESIKCSHNMPLILCGNLFSCQMRLFEWLFSMDKWGPKKVSHKKGSFPLRKVSRKSFSHKILILLRRDKIVSKILYYRRVSLKTLTNCNVMTLTFRKYLV